MKKITIITILLIICFFINIFITNKVYINAESIDSYKSKANILIEAHTNKVLFGKNENEELPIASMTKIMSLILIFEALEEKRIDYNMYLTCSEYAKSMGGSQIFLEENEKMKVDDLIKSVCVASANDATIMLVEKIAGNEANFVKKMNEKVVKLGLKNTFFSNATGLPSDKNHYSSCYDMAIISSYLINKYPKVLEYTKIYEDYIREDTDNKFWLVNTNKLMKTDPLIDGLKTGWTNEAGYCLTCTKKENNMRLISVVMGSDSVKNRSRETIDLLNTGFNEYYYEVIIPKDTIIKQNKNILIDPTIQNIKTSSDFGVVLKKGDKFENYHTVIDIDQNKIRNYYTFDIGKLRVFKDGNEVGSVEVEIVDNIKQKSFINLLKDLLITIFF